jgi:hypothetical protein
MAVLTWRARYLALVDQRLAPWDRAFEYLLPRLLTDTPLTKQMRTRGNTSLELRISEIDGRVLPGFAHTARFLFAFEPPRLGLPGRRGGRRQRGRRGRRGRGRRRCSNPQYGRPGSTLPCRREVIRVAHGSVVFPLLITSDHA